MWNARSWPKLPLLSVIRMNDSEVVVEQADRDFGPAEKLPSPERVVIEVLDNGVGITSPRDIIVGNPAIAVDISTILSERREALNQAEGDLTARHQPTASRGELKERILDRIRGYFGI